MNHHHPTPTNFPASKGAYAKIPKNYRRSSPRVLPYLIINDTLLQSFGHSHPGLYKKALKSPRVYAPAELVTRARVVLGVLWDRRWPDDYQDIREFASKAPAFIPELCSDCVENHILTVFLRFAPLFFKNDGSTR